MCLVSDPIKTQQTRDSRFTGVQRLSFELEIEKGCNLIVPIPTSVALPIYILGIRITSSWDPSRAATSHIDSVIVPRAPSLWLPECSCTGSVRASQIFRGAPNDVWFRNSRLRTAASISALAISGAFGYLPAQQHSSHYIEYEPVGASTSSLVTHPSSHALEKARHACGCTHDNMKQARTYLVKLPTLHTLRTSAWG